VSTAAATALEGPPESGPWWLRPARLFDGERMREAVALGIEEGRITTVVNADEVPVRAACWRTDCLAAPAFVDLQVNGGGGVLFNNEPTPQALAAIAAAHRRGGTGAWMPTLLTTTPEVMTRAVEAVLAVYGRHGIAGMHIEGPHISPDFRGAHLLEHIRPYDVHTRELVHRLRERAVPVIVTLAPERLPPGALRELVALGARVSLGHSGATEAQARRALEEGASLFTHLFNGMPPLQTKRVGMAGAALDSDAWCGVIADGWHVDDTMLRLAVRAKRGPGGLFAVTDAMATVHGPPRFELYGAPIQLRDGKLIDARGSLAGVHIDMIGTLRRLVRDVGLPIETALAMVTSGPARAAGIEARHGILVPRAQADIVLLEPEQLRLRHLLLDGARVSGETESPAVARRILA
jgi:N-acetylglucosamine-6-phosphate deacetylase